MGCEVKCGWGAKACINAIICSIFGQSIFSFKSVGCPHVHERACLWDFAQRAWLKQMGQLYPNNWQSSWVPFAETLLRIATRNSRFVVGFHGDWELLSNTSTTYISRMTSSQFVSCHGTSLFMIGLDKSFESSLQPAHAPTTFSEIYFAVRKQSYRGIVAKKSRMFVSRGEER